MAKLHVTYITSEDISSGLFASQVLAPIKKMAELNPDREFHLIVTNRPWKYIKHRKTLKLLRKSFLLKNNISLKYIPLLPPLRNFTKSKFLSKIAIYYVSFILSIFASS